MAKEAILTMKLEPDLRAAFVAEAAAIDRPASQVLRELMREFIARQQSAREYDEFLHARVALGREQVANGEVVPAAEVEARATARRAAAGY